jgi:16S rRNA processing protein RimM
MPEPQGEPATEELVLVGEVTAPFGIRGQVKLRPLMDRPEHLATLKEGVRLRWPADPKRPEQILRVKSVRPHGEGAVVLTLDGVTDRNGSEALREAQVFTPRSSLPALEPDAYYEADLLGLRVVTESGRDLGTVERVLFSANANDVYETDVAMIPAVADEVVLRVDLAARTMTVRDIPGLRKDEL